MAKVAIGGEVSELNYDAIKGALQLELEALRREVIAAREMVDLLDKRGQFQARDTYDKIRKQNEEQGI